MVLPGVPEVGGPVFSRGQLAAPTPPRGGLAARRAVALAVRWLRTGSFQAIRAHSDPGRGSQRPTGRGAVNAKGQGSERDRRRLRLNKH